MRVIVPPIKCQGIKTKLVPWIKELVGQHTGRWIEPFMGSGVVGFNISSSTGIFGDSNPHIIKFYRSIQSGQITASIVRQYLEDENSKLSVAGDAGYDHYRLVRNRFNESFEPLDFLFLSRAGFNGMIRFSQKGKWNIPFCKKPNRFAQAYVTKICNQVDNCSKLFKRDWEFTCQDFETTIKQAQSGDLIYCDPPYIGRYADYFNKWSESDEERLSELLRSTPARFILSSWHHNTFRSNVMLEKYWSDFKIITKDHFYHSGAKESNRNPIVEALVVNFELAGIADHNHGIREKSIQLDLID